MLQCPDFIGSQQLRELVLVMSQMTLDSCNRQHHAMGNRESKSSWPVTVQCAQPCNGVLKLEVGELLPRDDEAYAAKEL
jgi:hypothetical protein